MKASAAQYVTFINAGIDALRGVDVSTMARHEWSWIAPQEALDALAPQEVLDALGDVAWRSKSFATREAALASGIGDIGWTLQCRQVTPWETRGVMHEVDLEMKDTDDE